MDQRPPISSLRQELPFSDPAFTWPTFEAFFCDYLNARPVISLVENGREIRGEIIHSRLFGRPGDVQEGIDLLAEMRGGGVWDFQCKRVKKWTPEQTRRAIAAYQRDSSRRFLLVTCDVSEECHKLVADHPGWALWDAREITRRFRALGAAEGAQIMFTHFGPGWAEAFFGVPGNSPLIGAEANFQQQLREGKRFHHRLALIGRKGLLRELDDFANDESTRVLLLTGRGGLGKSRLLLEWSRRFSEQHPTRALRFVFHKNTDFGLALQAVRQPLMLVFDDAHRFDDVRRALLPELPNRTGVKLVLSLRPGPLDQVMQELMAEGFDTTEIITTKQMKPLRSEQAMELVDTALKPEFFHLRHYLRAASSDCPLIAVIGAELINSRELVESDLRVAKDVRGKVFASLLKDASAARAEFGILECDDFLRLLALLGPVKCDSAFFQRCAPFLGLAYADRVSRLRDALDNAGLLITTGAGTRVTPDLLSDHLAYEACYDVEGQSRAFAERLLGEFSPADFPKLMQHLAEAEWQAMSRKSGSISVVEPLWEWFRNRFEASSFHDRGEQIQQWGNIAHLQPERTLQLAELALSMTSAPDPESTWIRSYSTHQKALESLPQMLGPVAEHHPKFLGRCFEILWILGKDNSTGFHDTGNHPLAVMKQAITFKNLKPAGIHHAALDWLQRLFASDDWRCYRHTPGFLFEQFFQPLFATCIEVNWSSGRAFHYGSIPLNLKNTSPIRERLRGIIRSLLASRDSNIASQLIPTLERGCDIARSGMGGGDLGEAFNATWDEERLKCLAILEEMACSFSEPLIHLQINRVLMHQLRYGNDSPRLRIECQKIISLLPDSSDFHLARVAFGNCYGEFDPDLDRPDWQDVGKEKWEALVSRVATDLHFRFPAGTWFDHLTRLELRWRDFVGFQPNFRPVLGHIAKEHVDEALVVAQCLASTPDHPLIHTFDAIVTVATETNLVSRLELIRAAAESKSETLRKSVVECCSWWRRTGELPEEAWHILELLAQDATPSVAERISFFVWWNEQSGTLRDWQLLAALPFASGDASLAAIIASRAADLVVNSQLHPDPESIERFVARFETLSSLDGDDMERAFVKLAMTFPVPLFLALWRRHEARKSGNDAIKDLPYDFAQIPFRNLMSEPKVIAIVADFERRALAGDSLDPDELQLLRCAIQHSDGPSAWLETAVQRATSVEHLEILRRLGSVGEHGNAALAYPWFAKALLVRAREIGPACHQEMFQDLLYVGGGRGSVNHEPDDEWAALLESLEQLALEHSHDSELGPLFAEIAKQERLSVQLTRTRRFEGEEESDD